MARRICLAGPRRLIHGVQSTIPITSTRIALTRTSDTNRVSKWWTSLWPLTGEWWRRDARLDP